MKLGYIIGCLLSVLMWGLDRHELFYNINTLLKKWTKSEMVLQSLYLCIIFIIGGLLIYISPKVDTYAEIYNAVTAFLVIDISNIERKNIIEYKAASFNSSISSISKSLVCGFIAPLFCIAICGNCFAIIYMLIYHIKISNDFRIFNILFLIIIIIPSLISQGFLYLIYIFKFKKFKIDFEGDYFMNLFTNPVLNVDIIAAYMESVNFYCHNYMKKNVIKSYGRYNNRINMENIKDYLGISYIICTIVFIFFYAFMRF